MAATKEITVEDKLRSLFQLQKIDSQITEIKTVRGELPIQVRDMEDELVGLNVRIKHLEEEVAGAEQIIANYKTAKKEAEAAIKKYEKQQDNVKNNREFDALSKEIEMQKLEVQLCEKRAKDAAEDAKFKQQNLEDAQKNIKDKEKFLKAKKAELASLIEETEVEEHELLADSKSSRENIDERLLMSYDKIRKNYRNGLAVVPIRRGACGGCFNKIPPQKQMEIKMHRKVTACEHCGRILVDEAIDMV
jgi:predicted  nucleic acid-binding Zn-ribbon protein